MSKARQYRDFDQYLRESIRDPKDAAEYLSAAAEDGDNSVFLLALKDVLDVHGSLSELSRNTRLNRANLHRMLRGKSSPRLDTLTKVLNSAGLRISITAIPREPRRPGSARAVALQSTRNKRRTASG